MYLRIHIHGREIGKESIEKEELFTSSAALHNDDPFAATGLTAMRIDYECN